MEIERHILTRGSSSNSAPELRDSDGQYVQMSRIRAMTEDEKMGNRHGEGGTLLSHGQGGDPVVSLSS
jgi:hypothetical protein